MTTDRSNPALKQPFERRLMRYALAGGALVAAPAAHAAIISSGPLDLTVSSPGSLQVSFNPLAGNITDFTVTVGSDGSGGTSISVGQNTGAAFDIGPLAYGTPITSADITDTASSTTLVDFLKAGGASGPWANLTGPAYLGVEFTVSSQDYLGWAELQWNATPSATLLDYAYNDQPLESIDAGDSGTPEPSSLALFALGAAGVMALRRRRKAA